MLDARLPMENRRARNHIWNRKDQRFESKECLSPDQNRFAARAVHASCLPLSSRLHVDQVCSPTCSCLWMLARSIRFKRLHLDTPGVVWAIRPHCLNLPWKWWPNHQTLKQSQCPKIYWNRWLPYRQPFQEIIPRRCKSNIRMQQHKRFPFQSGQITFSICWPNYGWSNLQG